LDHLLELSQEAESLSLEPPTWEDLAQDVPAWRISVKTGEAIYEANRIVAAKAKRVARKSQEPWINTKNAQALPTHIPCAKRPGQTSSNSMQNNPTRWGPSQVWWHAQRRL
uniref:WW domain-containing protein n=1 Tax=Schistocephalus solidus TaxID=70667 RepID=A0A183SI15_SCHSO